MKSEVIRDPRLWTLLAAGSAALTTMVVRRALGHAWVAVKKTPPPRRPEQADVKLSDALIWAGATGLAIGVGHVLARRAAAAGWRKATGRKPPV